MKEGRYMERVRNLIAGMVLVGALVPLAVVAPASAAKHVCRVVNP
jgi:hypothetical protein